MSGLLGRSWMLVVRKTLPPPLFSVLEFSSICKKGGTDCVCNEQSKVR